MPFIVLHTVHTVLVKYSRMLGRKMRDLELTADYVTEKE